MKLNEVLAVDKTGFPEGFIVTEEKNCICTYSFCYGHFSQPPLTLLPSVPPHYQHSDCRVLSIGTYVFSPFMSIMGWIQNTISTCARNSACRVQPSQLPDLKLPPLGIGFQEAFGAAVGATHTHKSHSMDRCPCTYRNTVLDPASCIIPYHVPMMEARSFPTSLLQPLKRPCFWPHNQKSPKG